MLILVMPSFAQVRWQRFYGGAGEDGGLAIAELSDGFALSGHTNSFGNGGFDFYVVRITGDGDTVWARAVGGADDDFAKCIAPAPDGGVIAAGLTYSFGAGNSDVYIVKFDSLGDTVWTKTYGGAIADEAYDMIETGWGYLLAGRTYSFGAGNFDVYLLAINWNGDTLWTRTYGGTITDGANSVIPTGDGFLITGYTYSYGAGNYDVYVLRVDSAGNELWQRTYGGSDDDVGTDAVMTPDGGFIIVGYTYTFTHGSDDIFVVRIDSSGNLLWQRNFGGGGIDEAMSIVRRGDAYLVGGVTESYGSGRRDAYIIAVDEQGNTLGQYTFGSSGNDGCNDLLLASDGDLVFAGYSNHSGSYDFYAVKFYASQRIDETDSSMTEQGFRLSVTPGAGIELFISQPGEFDEIRILNAAGMEMAGFRGASLSGHMVWSPQNSGVYFVVLKGRKGMAVRKVFYLR